MKNKDTLFKIKIISGYLIPVLIGFGVVWYLFVYIVPMFSTNEYPKDEVFKKVIYTGSALSSLYETQLLSMALIQEPTKGNCKAYKRSIEKVYSDIDSIQKITNQPSQQAILEKLSNLLDKKESNLWAILWQIKNENEDTIVKQSMSSLKVSIDSVPTRIRIREKIQYDTVFPTPEKKKNLWKRIGEVFSPSTPETISQIKIIRTFSKDTIQSPFNTYDTVFNAVERVLENVYVEKAKTRKTTNKKLKILLENDKVINAEINSLLSELQTEAFLATSADIHKKQDLLAKSGKAIVAVGILAILAIVLFIFLILRDLRKSSIHRRELEEARIRAEELMQSREKLLLTISHDIKAPLSSIAGYIELMNLSELDADKREYVTSMNYSIQHVMDLLNNLLEYSRLEANKVELVSDIFPLSGLFEEVCLSFYPLAKRKDLSLTLTNTIDPSVFVEMDKVRLKQILTNLISNALKFTEKGSVSLAASLRRKQKNGNEYLLFSVSDTGIGISPEKRNLIFEEFSRISTPKTQQKSGSGFGLFIVKRMVDLFHGHISVKENQPNGSIFEVQLPIKKVPAPEKMTQTNCANILVVDDDLSQLKLMETILNKLGHSATLVDTIDKCVEQLNHNHFDILITDIQLQNATGFDLLEIVKASNNDSIRRLPVIAISANSEYSQKDFLEKGFAAFIRKPFTMQQLECLLTQFCLSGNANPLPSEFTKMNAVPTSAESLYNLDALRQMVGNDAETIKQILELFISSAKESRDLLENYLKTNDYEKIKLLAHKMLPMSQQLGIKALAEILSILETYNIAETTYPGFRTKVSSAICLLDEVLKELELLVQGTKE